MSEPRQTIITGISSELGGIIAKELATTFGVSVIGTMRRRQAAHEDFSENVRLVDACDLSSSEGCCRVVSAVERFFRGKFDLVHCAGDFWDHVPFLDVSCEAAKAMFDSHVTTFYNTVRSLIPLMKTRGGGSVVTFTCNSALYHYPWMAAFTASKTAIDSLITSLANEYSGDNLRFNSLRLSSLKTEAVRRSKPHGDFAHFTPPHDIVPLVRFLLSDEAYLINGNNISVFRHSAAFYGQGYFERVSK